MKNYIRKDILMENKKHLTKSGFTLKGGRHSWMSQEFQAAKKLRATGIIPGNCRLNSAELGRTRGLPL